MSTPGRPKDVSDEEILRQIKLTRGPVVTAPELAERIGISGSATNKRLKTFVEQGLVRKREVGARAVVYWLTEKGKAAAAGD